MASLVEVEPGDLAVSAIEEAEPGEGLGVRFWNTGTEPVDGTIRSWRQPSRVSRCKMAEREIETLDTRANVSVHAALGPRQVATILGVFD